MDICDVRSRRAGHVCFRTECSANTANDVLTVAAGVRTGVTTAFIVTAFMVKRSLMIPRVWIVSATLCLVFSCVAAAWQTPSAKPPAKADSHAVSITDEDNGKDVDLTSGGALIVKLKSNPATGYSWAVAGDPSPLKLEKTSYRKNTASSKVVGAPGVQVFRFDAGSAGIATLQLIYHRSWEYNVAPAKTFGVRVNVR